MCPHVALETNTPLLGNGLSFRLAQRCSVAVEHGDTARTAPMHVIVRVIHRSFLPSDSSDRYKQQVPTIGSLVVVVVVVLLQSASQVLVWLFASFRSFLSRSAFCGWTRRAGSWRVCLSPPNVVAIFCGGTWTRPFSTSPSVVFACESQTKESRTASRRCRRVVVVFADDGCCSCPAPCCCGCREQQ